jgi:hypothetical protein
MACGLGAWSILIRAVVRFDRSSLFGVADRVVVAVAPTDSAVDRDGWSLLLLLRRGPMMVALRGVSLSRFFGSFDRIFASLRSTVVKSKDR